MNSNALNRALRTLPLLGLLILTSCSGMALTFGPTAPVATTDGSKPPIPLACFDFTPLPYNIGKHEPGGPFIGTVQDVLDALKDPINPLGAARNVLGDTLSTRAELDDYRGRRVGLNCPDPGTPPAKSP
jgi:hypothetical protein